MGRVSLPDFIYPGAIVRVMDWVGVVLGIEGNIITIESPKRVLFAQTTLDVLDYSLAPWLWQPATMEDLIKEADTQRAALSRAKRRGARANKTGSRIEDLTL
jgi:hypothetical protein